MNHMCGLTPKDVLGNVKVVSAAMSLHIVVSTPLRYVAHTNLQPIMWILLTLVG